MNLYSCHNVTSYVDVECDGGSMTMALGIGCDARYLLPGKRQILFLTPPPVTQEEIFSLTVHKKLISNSQKQDA